MTRSRLIRLFWPLAIWVAVLGWRTVGCKKQEAPGTGRHGRHPTIHYSYPPPGPTITVPPGFTPVGTLGE